MTRIVHAIAQNEIFPDIIKFVLPHEKFNNTLYEKLLTQDDSVYVLFSDSNRIEGVISFSKGNSLVCCIPKWTGDIQESLSIFLENKKVSCIHGEESIVLKIEKLLNGRNLPKDERNLFMMEYDKMVFMDLPAQAFLCNRNHIDQLMPLQTGFSVEEVLPPWKDINPALERLSLERAIQNDTVYAIGEGDEIFSKANISFYSKKFLQISGVYTRNEFRGNGYATALVNRLAILASKVGLNASLIVRQENLAALMAYKKAGFGITGTYRIVYYKH